jgi:hypothetical protein
MIYEWVKIDITQSLPVTEAGTFTISTPKVGCWHSVVKMKVTIIPSDFEEHCNEFQILFGEEEKTGTMTLDFEHPFEIDLSQYHEALSGEVDEPLKIKTTCSSVQGFALISESKE